jgi:hypothetical protein
VQPCRRRGSSSRRLAPNVKNYDHRLMDYNNDPMTTFADVQKVLGLLKDRIKQRLVEETPANKKR